MISKFPVEQYYTSSDTLITRCAIWAAERFIGIFSETPNGGADGTTGCTITMLAEPWKMTDEDGLGRGISQDGGNRMGFALGWGKGSIGAEVSVSEVKSRP